MMIIFYNSFLQFLSALKNILNSNYSLFESMTSNNKCYLIFSHSTSTIVYKNIITERAGIMDGAESLL